MSASLKHIGYFIISTIMLSSCAHQKPQQISDSKKVDLNNDSSSVELNALAYSDLSGDVNPDTTEGLVNINGKGELVFKVNVPIPGRYRFQVEARGKSDSASVWMEDYINNKDDRTYNITSTINIPEQENFGNFEKDGVPLNKGIHEMRFHGNGSFAFKKFSFILLKKHRVTPKVLTQNMKGNKWQLVWSDEFNGTGLPDTSKWTYDIGNWGWGNNELEYYTENRIENARQENGHLVIEARKNDLGYPWTSARLTTRGKESFRFGKIEFRAKIPVYKGNWAAGWLLGDSYVDELSWPYCGEIDVLESVGFETNNATGEGINHGSAHCGAYYFKLGNQPTSTTPVQNINSQWHTYSLNWSPSGLTWAVDGHNYFSYSDTTSALSWPFDKPQDIILNLAIGGDWGGSKGLDEAVTSEQMLIDYVRVYQKEKD